MTHIGSPRFRGEFLGAFRHSYLECRAARDLDKDRADWALLLHVPGVCAGGTLGLTSEPGGWRVLVLFVQEAHGAGSGGGQALGRVLWMVGSGCICRWAVDLSHPKWSLLGLPVAGRVGSAGRSRGLS